MGTKLGRMNVPAQGIVFHHHRITKTSQRDQLRQIKDLGFDIIHTEESPVAPGKSRGPLAPAMAWNHIEIGKNRYDWEFMDQLVEDCAAVELQLILDIELPHHLPEWVAQENPDTEVLSPTGEKIGAFIRPNFCYVDYHMRCFSLAHPACREAAVDFMSKVSARYAGSDTVVGHAIIEELGLNYPHSLTWYGQDVGAVTVAGFAVYLEKKYGDVSAMNETHGTSYQDFPAAAGDRTRFRYAGRPHPLWPDWCYYRSAYVSRFFRDIRDAVKQADPGALVITTSNDGQPNYWVVQGIRSEEMNYFDLVARQSNGGLPEDIRDLLGWARTGRTNVLGINNLNTPDCGLSAGDMVRKWYASLGMGSKWNALYSWHWYSHEDPVTGKRVLHDNLKGFLPYLKCVRHWRDFLGGLTPAPAEIAILKPVRSDMINFWQRHDPRLRRRSHCRGDGDSVDRTQDMWRLLGNQNVPFDIIAEEFLLEDLGTGRYKLLVIGEYYLPAALAAGIRAWVERGGKLLLMHGAAQYDEYGKPAGFFDDLIQQQNVGALGYKDFVGWEQDGAFPLNAKVLLAENANSLQLPSILTWANIRPSLDFIDDTRHEPLYGNGAGPEPDTSNPYVRAISVYPMLDAKGAPVYVLIRKGTNASPLEKVPVAWNDGPVRVMIPPSSEAVRVEPSNGQLLLPTWRDVIILMPE